MIRTALPRANGSASIPAMLRYAMLLMFVLVGCNKEPVIYHPENEGPPPLPPASGTAIGYLLDNAGQLELREEQRVKLKEIDDSLAARNDVLDTQLRQIERPDEEPQQKDQPPPRHNNAPGAQVKTTGDAAKLHQAKKDNDRYALERAFAILDEKQQALAKRLLEDRGIATPGGDKKAEPPRTSDDGVPLEP